MESPLTPALYPGEGGNQRSIFTVGTGSSLGRRLNSISGPDATGAVRVPGVGAGRCLVRLGVLLAAFAVLDLPAQPVGGGDTSVALEALSRLKGIDVEANPSLKAALLRVLEQVRGRPEFVEIVRDFKIAGEGPALLAFAAAQPSSPAGVEAMRLLIAGGETNLVIEALGRTNAAGVVEALGNTADKHVVAMLEPLLGDADRDGGLRRRVIRALAQTQEGARVVLREAAADRLPEDLKFTAATALRQVPWAPLQAEAAKVFPPPQGLGGQALPPLSELLKRSGDARRGAEVYRRDIVACIRCHRVNGEGIEVGPALTEIGTKLGRDALFESILDPSAGIAFGYEAWQLELKDGDEAFGIIVSETTDELVLKAQTGVVSRYRKPDIVRRERQRLSIMPAGLEQGMSAQDLVDLVEYLGSLKKAGP